MALTREWWRHSIPEVVQETRQVSAPVQLAWLGAFALILYVITLAIPFSVFELGDRALLNLSELTGRTPTGIARYVISLGPPFLLYVAGFLLLRRHRVPLAPVIVFTVLAGLVLLVVYPLTATDVFLYGRQARVLTDHGANPYETPPSNFPDDPMDGWSAFGDQPTAYGPLWTLLAAIPALAGGDDPIRVALGMKALALAALVATVLLSFRVAEDLRPGSGVAAAYLLGWNPVVLWSVAGDGHNDIVMMAPVMLALFLLPRLPFLALPAVAAAGMVKFAALVLAPFIVVYLWRRGYNRVLLTGSLAAAGALVVALLAPFWDGPSTLSAVAGQVNDMITMSPGALFALLAEWLGMSQVTARAVAQTALYEAFAILYLVLLVRLRGRPESLARTAFWAMFLLILLGTFWFRFWYILWLMPLAAVLVGVDRRLAITGMIFSGTAALIYVFTDYTWVWLGLEFGLTTHLIVVLTVFAPPLLYWAAAEAMDRWRPARRIDALSSNEAPARTPARARSKRAA